MKSLLLLLLFLLVVIPLTLLLGGSEEQVLIRLLGWDVQMSVVLFLLVIIALFAVLHGVFNLFGSLQHIPRHLRQASRQRRLQRERDQLHDGLHCLMEGDWRRAEKLLKKGARLGERPLLFYLGAAEAAWRSGSLARCHAYLEQARASEAGAELSVGLLEARLHQSAGQGEKARQCLQELHHNHPKAAAVLHENLLELALQSEDWEAALEHLAGVRVVAKERREVQVRAYTGLLRTAGSRGERDTLERIWEQRLSWSLRREPRLVAAYVAERLRWPQAQDCEALLRPQLRRHHDDENLAVLYGLTPGRRPDRQLRLVEALLRKQSDSAGLLLAAGLLSIRLDLRGKARDYLEQSIHIRPSTEALRALAALLEHEGDLAGALQAYRRESSPLLGNLTTPAIAYLPPAKNTSP